jgi:hypothetical protein
MCLYICGNINIRIMATERTSEAMFGNIHVQSVYTIGYAEEWLLYF